MTQEFFTMTTKGGHDALSVLGKYVALLHFIGSRCSFNENVVRLDGMFFRECFCSRRTVREYVKVLSDCGLLFRIGNDCVVVHPDLFFRGSVDNKAKVFARYGFGSLKQCVRKIQKTKKQATKKETRVVRLA